MMLSSASSRVRCCSRGVISAAGSSVGNLSQQSTSSQAASTGVCHLQSSTLQSGGSTRTYVSRAHPREIPEHPVKSAIQMVLDGIEERKVKRAAKWERNAEARQAKGKEVSFCFFFLFFFKLYSFW